MYDKGKISQPFLLNSKTAARWQANFEIYKAFKEERGREPKSKEVYRGVRIGEWCSRQRTKYQSGGLSEAQVRELRDVGFRFKILDRPSRLVPWDEKFELLKEYLDEKGHFPASRDVYRGFKIGSWCDMQKLKSNNPNFPKDRLQKLMDIGLLFDTQNVRWEKHFEMLKQFIEVHNRFPFHREVYCDFNLGFWCSKQKQLAKESTYPAERYQKLREIGLLENFVDYAWNSRYELCEKFIVEHRRLPLRSDLCEDFHIGTWLYKQRVAAEKPTYPQDRLKKLRVLFELAEMFKGV